MTTLMQIFAVAVVGVTAGALIATGIGASIAAPAERPRKFFNGIASWLSPHAGGLGIAVAVLAAFLFWTQSWSFWVARSTERKAFANLTSEQAAFQDAAQGNANMPFLGSVGEVLADGQTYAIAPTETLENAFLKQWASYVLLPNLLTDEADADLLVIYNADPAEVDYDRKRFSKLEEFEPGYAIARRAE